jgi:hypothetical protein
MDIEPWHELFVATAGAAAALAGLMIVAMSVNISTIIGIQSMTSRAGATIAGLVLIVVVSVAGLIPDQPALALGIETLVFSLVALAFAVQASFAIVRAPSPMAKRYSVMKALLVTVPIVLFAIGGVLICFAVPGALFWIAAGIILAFVTSIVNSWVLLVEILR